MNLLISDWPPDDARNWVPQCARCGSSTEYVECDQCQEGFSHHDCGEDCCNCVDDSPNVSCDVCGGRGGWNKCGNSWQWCKAHPAPGREAVKPNTIEWLFVEEAFE